MAKLPQNEDLLQLHTLGVKLPRKGDYRCLPSEGSAFNQVRETHKRLLCTSFEFINLWQEMSFQPLYGLKYDQLLPILEPEMFELGLKAVKGL